jgi:hypothetical protein
MAGRQTAMKREILKGLGWRASRFLVGICSYFVGNPNAEELIRRFGLVAGHPPA